MKKAEEKVRQNGDIHIFTPEVVQNIIQRMKQRKAQGADGLIADLVMQWPYEMYGVIVEAFNARLANLRDTSFPEDWGLSPAVMIPKKINPASVRDYREIILGAILKKSLPERTR